jgi:hypothetical protein
LAGWRVPADTVEATQGVVSPLEAALHKYAQGATKTRVKKMAPVISAPETGHR